MTASFAEGKIILATILYRTQNPTVLPDTYNYISVGFLSSSGYPAAQNTPDLGIFTICPTYRNTLLSISTERFVLTENSRIY
jgi:hypothetical protein